MKIKLKEGVSVSDLPKVSSDCKGIANMFGDNDIIEVDVVPGKILNYVEEITSNKSSSKNKKGDK
tara:strand:- start:58 stop:252 length:195 start_codon:yes stop_codon:yes gene_type:complete